MCNRPLTLASSDGLAGQIGDVTVQPGPAHRAAALPGRPTVNTLPSVLTRILTAQVHRELQ